MQALKKIRTVALLDPEVREEMIGALAPLESVRAFLETAILREARRRARTGPRPCRLSPPRGRRPARAA